MPLMNWDPSLEIGHAMVDEDHRTLIRIIGELHESIRTQRARAVLEKVLVHLNVYIVEHFAREEELMREANYPGLALHQKAHAELARQTTEVLSAYRTGRITLPVTVAPFLQDWLWRHILSMDKTMIAYIRDHPRDVT